MSVTDHERATYLAALAAEGGYVEMPGALAVDIADAQRMLVLTDLEKRGHVHVANRLANGMGVLVSAHDVTLTAAGREALKNYQRTLHSATPSPAQTAVPYEEKRRRRAAFMRAMYDETDGRLLMDVDSHDLGSRLGLSDDETDAVVEYLVNEQLLEHAGMGDVVSITHRGVGEVEEALRQPERDTEHFAAGTVIVQVFGDNNAPLQAAGAGSNQQVTAAPNIDVVREFLAEFTRLLPTLPVSDDEREAATADAEALALQLASPKPRPAAVRALTAALVSVSLGVSGNATYDGLVALAHRVL